MIQPSPATTTVRRLDTDIDVLPAPHHPVPIGQPSFIRWGAVIAGTFISIAMQVMFAVLGSAVGLTILGVADDAPEKSLTVGAGAWWLITGLIALFVGGGAASCLSGTFDRAVGATHGLLAWCTITVLSAWLVAMAGGAAVGGSLSIMNDSLMPNRVTRGFANLDQTTRPVRSDINRHPPVAGDQPAGDIASLPYADGTLGDRLDSAIDANTPVLTDAERKDAASTAATLSWWTFAALGLGVGVASLGGMVATRRQPIPPGA